MTATEELRRLLDERGVEYTQEATAGGVLFIVVTRDEHYFILVRDNDAGIEMWSQYLTPEQAIAATLGRGECHKVRVHMPIEDEMHCSECGRFLGFAGDVGAPPYNFCPNCGAKVVDAEVDG